MKSKVFCHNNDIINAYLTFTKGKYYEIVPTAYMFYKLEDDCFCMAEDISCVKKYIHLKSNEGYTVSFGCPEEYDKHFITIKQLRKNKLEKLYEK